MELFGSLPPLIQDLTQLLVRETVNADKWLIGALDRMHQLVQLRIYCCTVAIPGSETEKP